jgi:hypothetical protein
MIEISRTPQQAHEAMTLGELRAFVASARREGIPDDALVAVRTSGFSTLRIREISADDRHTVETEARRRR